MTNNGIAVGDRDERERPSELRELGLLRHAAECHKHGGGGSGGGDVPDKNVLYLAYC